MEWTAAGMLAAVHFACDYSAFAALRRAGFFAGFSAPAEAFGFFAGAFFAFSGAASAAGFSTYLRGWRGLPSLSTTAVRAGRYSMRAGLPSTSRTR